MPEAEARCTLQQLLGGELLAAADKEAAQGIRTRLGEAPRAHLVLRRSGLGGGSEDGVSEQRGALMRILRDDREE